MGSDVHVHRNSKVCLQTGAASEARRLVHIDLKGAPPKVRYLEELFPCLKSWGATGLLIEYEDMFPYHDMLQVLACPGAYSADDVQLICHLAKLNGLDVIPLIQTFGHLEFVLKHKCFRHMRELPKSPASICPAHADSLTLIKEMVKQVLELHRDSTWIHVGADEVWNLGECERCRDVPKDHIYLSHVSVVARHIRSTYPGKIPIVWDDMIRCMDAEVLKGCELVQLVEPMIWHYLSQNFFLPQDTFDKLSLISDHLWVATAFKGSTGPWQDVPNLEHHIRNHEKWLEVIHSPAVLKFRHFRGWALTGWQRYDHFAVLCELLPVAIPCLAICLQAVVHGCFNEDTFQNAMQMLGLTNRMNIMDFLRMKQIPGEFNFPGKDVFFGIQAFCALQGKYVEFKNDTIYKGWFSDYHLKHNFNNIYRVEFMLSVVFSLLRDLGQLRSQLESSLSQIYFENAIEEWFCEKFDHITNNLLQIEGNLLSMKSGLENE